MNDLVISLIRYQGPIESPRSISLGSIGVLHSQNPQITLRRSLQPQPRAPKDQTTADRRRPAVDQPTADILHPLSHRGTISHRTDNSTHYLKNPLHLPNRRPKRHRSLRLDPRLPDLPRHRRLSRRNLRRLSHRWRRLLLFCRAFHPRMGSNTSLDYGLALCCGELDGHVENYLLGGSVDS
jgi:hypothetical protein